MASDDVEVLRKANAALEAKATALKLALGIPEVQDDVERRRIEQLFKSFDRDGNGYIDKSEFDVLAFECGADVSQLTEEGLANTFAQVNKKGDGKITFADFYAWLQESKDNKDQGGLGLVRLRLMSRLWAKQFENLRAEAKKIQETQAQKHQHKEEKQVAVGSAAAAAAAPGKEVSKFVHFQVQVGKFAEAKAGITFSMNESQEDTATLREQVNCPEDVTAFVFLDFGLQPDCDDMKVGELCGTLEVLIDAIPIQQLQGPFEVYHSHSVDVHEAENGAKSLRVTVFLKPKLSVVFQGFLNDKTVSLQDLYAGRFFIEFPFSLDEFYADPQARFTPEKLKIRFGVDGNINRHVLAKVQSLLGTLSPNMQYNMNTNLALIRFIEQSSFDIRFGDLGELLEHIPETSVNMIGLKHGINGIGQMPVGERLLAMAKGLAPMFAEHKELYTSIKECLTGVQRLHVQAEELSIRWEIKGFNFVQFLPDPADVPDPQHADM